MVQLEKMHSKLNYLNWMNSQINEDNYAPQIAQCVLIS